jgi:hypothetical protein
MLGLGNYIKPRAHLGSSKDPHQWEVATSRWTSPDLGMQPQGAGA